MTFNNRLSSARLAIRSTSLSWLTGSKRKIDSPRRYDIPPVMVSNWQNRDGLRSGVTLLLVSCYDAFAPRECRDPECLCHRPTIWRAQ